MGRPLLLKYDELRLAAEPCLAGVFVYRGVISPLLEDFACLKSDDGGD